ncbi:MAG: DNA cytosine methyltransferase [Bacteroidales bacterium]|nr:DNA cytosine methyltransferase [Bacteroidales bacterium]
MKTTNKSTTFSLFDFCKRRAEKVEIYGKESLDENGEIIPFIEQAAYVTHYLQLKSSCIEISYAYKAEALLNLWYDFVTGQDGKSAQQEDSIAESSSVMQQYLFPDLFQAPFQAPQNPKFTFIDLFAGIGGFRMAFQNLGGECVFSSEWDEQARKTYYANYGDVPFGDITKETVKNKIPQGFDILCAGFPCQAFSLAGKRLGFEETRGTLFFDVAEILRRYQPKAFFLENVKGLVIHDKGRTFKTILNALDEVGYVVPDPQIVNAMYFGVPQHRERIYIVGFRKDLGIKKEDFTYPEQKEVTKKWVDVREEHPVPAKYYLSTQYIQTLINHKARHEAKGHGFGYDIIPDDGIAHAIVVGGMGRECNLVIDFRQTDLTPTTRIKGEVNKQGWRKMTPREWARLQGYPDNFKIVVADASAYKQFGNSVAVPAIQATAKQLLTTLNEHGFIGK